MYACVVAGTASDTPASPREQLWCISEIARSGAHESCSVPRSAPQPCPGMMKIVAAPPAELEPPVADAEADPQNAVPEDAGVGAAAPVEPVRPDRGPRTVEELAKQSVKSSQAGLEKAGEAVTGTAKKAGEQVEKAGSAVGTAAKKTWNCLTSLFSDC